MRIFVKYNQGGEILSVAKTETLPEGVEQPYGSLSENEFVLEATKSKNLADLSAIDIHERFKVNVAKKSLITKPA